MSRPPDMGVDAEEYRYLVGIRGRTEMLHPLIPSIIPFSGPTDNGPSGVAMSTNSGGRNFDCWFLNDTDTKVAKYQASSLELLKWTRITAAKLAAWTIRLADAAEAYVPMIPQFLNTHPDRCCWNCHVPVGWDAWSLGCAKCGYSVCLRCGNCFSSYPGGRNVDTHERIPPQPQHVSIEVGTRTRVASAATKTFHVLLDRYPDSWDLLEALSPSWPRLWKYE